MSRTPITPSMPNSSIPSEWPESLRRSLARIAYGQPVVGQAAPGTKAAAAAEDLPAVVHGIQPLGGMSGSGVVAVALGADPERPSVVIVKRCASPVESAFYRSIAPLLERFGLGIPRLLAGVASVPQAATGANEAAQSMPVEWLVLEAIPQQLPDDDFAAVRAPLAQYLAQLHAVTRHLLSSALAAAGDLPETTHTWTDAHTAAALATLGSDDPRLPTTLATLQAAAQPIFEPWCRVSGDANVRNWGLRLNGSLVLFDWEQTGRATPAYDLGTLLPGLPDLAAYRDLAADYLAAWERMPTEQGIAPLPWSAEELARLALLARVATLVHLLAGAHDGSADVPANLQAWLRRTAPGWLQKTAAALGLAKGSATD